MDYKEAIQVIKSNYPPSNYTMLREALDMAINEFKIKEDKQLPFRLKVRKFKCIEDDLIFLVEDLPHYDVMWSCPHCNGSHVEEMDRIVIVQE